VPELPAPRNIWIDILRGMGAVGATVYHLNEPYTYEDNWYRFAVKLCWHGVDMFFVLSGFCIHLAAIRSRTVPDYAWRRLMRIFPPYWASLLLVGVVCVIRKMIFGVNDRATWPSDFMGWLATISAMVKPATDTPGVNWVYWILPFELAYYAVTALAVKWPRHFPLVVIAITIASVCFPGMKDRPGLFFIELWPIYGVGVGLSLLVQGRRGMGTAVTLSCILAVCYVSSLERTIAICLTAFSIALSHKTKFFYRRPVGIFGKLSAISYSLYLVHVPIGCWLLLSWKRGEWETNPWLNFLYDFIVLQVCLVASVVFYYLIEKPALFVGRLPYRIRQLRATPLLSSTPRL
jgi:peptidoglycan/LPS O-acetylase OafA/YrhL